jgi:ABC-2 type transport system permease protein
VSLGWRAFRGAVVMHLRLYLFRQGRIITGLALPAVMAAIAVLALRHDAAGPAKYFHVMVGGGLAGAWGSVLGTALLTLRREREWYGTLPLLVAVPARLDAVFGGYLVAEALAGLVAVAMSMGTGALLLGYPTGLRHPATLLVSLPLAAVAIAAVAFPLMAAALQAPVLTRWINGLDYPVWILAGFLFPVALLPGWLSPLSRLLPAYWATEAVRRGAGEGGFAAAGSAWLLTAALSVGYALLALAVLRAVVRRARRSGALVAG